MGADSHRGVSESSEAHLSGTGVSRFRLHPKCRMPSDVPPRGTPPLIRSRNSVTLKRSAEGAQNGCDES